MIDLSNHHIGTYAKTLIQDQILLTQAVHKKALTVKEQLDSSDNSNKHITLTDQHLNDILNGPFQHHFKQHFNAVGKIGQVAVALSLSHEEPLKAKDFEEEIDHGVADNILRKIEFSDIKSMRQSLDKLQAEQLEKLELQIESWAQELLATIAENNLPLTDHEIQDFITNEPISELNDRFINLKLAPPKLKKSAFDFRQYFTLKATLTVHSALSRSHLPNTTKDIEVITNKLKPILKTIQDTEKTVLKTYEAEIHALIAALH